MLETTAEEMPSSEALGQSSGKNDKMTLVPTTSYFNVLLTLSLSLFLSCCLVLCLLSLHIKRNITSKARHIKVTSSYT